MRLINAIRAAWLRYVIWETEHYLKDCYRDGLHESLALTEFRHQLAAMRVRLALLQRRI